MKTRQVKQYICDFCGKKGLAAGHMKAHEKHCTMNPDRACRMCECAINVREAVAKAQAREDLPKWDGQSEPPDVSPEFEKFIEDEADTCPACALAIVRQSGAKGYYYPYKQTAEAYLREKREKEHDCYIGAYYSG
jgi:hypothetical protein